MMWPYRSRLCLVFVSASWIFTDIAVGEVPLHQQIDNVLAESQIGPPAALAGDAEFLRRISLDLTGRIPSSTAARKFLGDQSPDKRQRLIEELIQSPQANRHLAKVLDIMLMERRPDKHVKGAEWDAYLLASVQQNKPWNQLAREILSADGADPNNRAPVKFYLDREDLSVNLLTRDTARVFFGRDIECAQCHDHPLISDYEQSEYFGLLAFLNRSTLFQPADKKQPAVIAETAEGLVKFKSVFTGYEGETLPRLPGETEITEPVFKTGEEYLVKPAKNVRPVPKYSRREKLAELATAGTNAAFNKNIANRLWAVMLGRGLVNPVDLHHSENPPASPELLDLLSREFVAMKFDIKQFLKEISLSSAYQRSFRMPATYAENIAIAQQQLPKLQAEQTRHQQQAESLAQKIETLEAELKSQRATAKPIGEKAKAAQAQLAAAEKTRTEAQAALTKLQQSLTAKQEIANLLAEAAKKANLAAQKLPDDKSLAQASSAIAAQSLAWTQQTAAVQKQHEQQSATVKDAETQLAAVRSVSQVVQAELAKREAVIQKADAEYNTARQQKNTALAAGDSLGRDIERLNLLIDYASASQQLAAGRDAAKSVETQLAAAQTESAFRADELAKQKQQLADLQTAQTEALQTLAGTKTGLTNQTQAAQLVVEALAQVESARKQLPEDKQLAAVVQQLGSTRDHQQEQKSALDKQVGVLQTASEKTALRMADVEKTIAETENALKQSQQTAKTFTEQHQTAAAELAKREGAFAEADAALAESWTKHFRVAGVEQLSPEQLAWSVLEAVGQVEQQQTAALAAWNKLHADLAGKELTPVERAEQAEFIEQTLRSKLQALAGKFLPLFAASPGQPQHEFFATVEQALFLSNGNDVLAWLRPGGGNLTDRLRQIQEPKPLAVELYLSIFTRLPSAEEIQDVTDYLSQRKEERDQAIQEIAWALLTSAEFRFQH